MRKILWVLLAAISAIPSLAQGPPITKQIAQQYDTPPFVQAPTVANFSAAPAVLGNATCYYWIVTQSTNPSATSVPLLLPLFICPTASGGTAQNPVSLNWSLVPGATYDVLETTTSAMPTGTNTVAIATGLTVGNLTDSGQARSSYTLLPSGLNWQEFNNLIAGVPTLQWCYNGSCILNVTPTGVNVTPTAPPGGGTGTAGGACTAVLAPPGTVCAGPIPTANGVNPSFETSFINNGGTSLASPATISGAPLTTNPSIALLVTTLGSGSQVNAPDGTWTLLDFLGSPGFTIYRKNLASTATLNLSSTFNSGGNTSWMDYLFFYGGTFGSIPHTATSSTLTCSAANDQCATATISSVTANNALFMVGLSNSANLCTLCNATITDSLGDTWTKVGSTNTDGGGPAPANSFVYTDQSASAGTHVINLDSHQNTTIIGGCCKVYELAGAAPYFTGASGPPSFRYLTTQDLAIGGVIAQSVGASKTVTLSSNVTVTGSDTTVQTITLQAPQSGCPCRALISYSGWANFAGVTNEPDFDFWVFDGTNKMVPFTSGQSNASTGATTAISASGLSTTGAGAPVSYLNGVSVTFTLHGIVSSANAGTIQFSYQAAQPTGGSGANSFFQVTFVPSSF